MRLLLCLLLAAGALATGGCVSEPPAVVIPGGRSTGAFVLKHVVQDVAGAQGQAEQYFQSTLAQAAQVASLDPLGFAASYPVLIPELQRCESQAAMAGRLLQGMDGEGGSAPPAVQARYAQASAAMHATQSTMDNLLEYCRTQMLYLKKNPQVAGTDEVRSWAKNLRAELKHLHTQVRRSTAEAEAVAKAL